MGGALLAELQKSLKELELPGVEKESQDREWVLENITKLQKYLKYLDSDEKRKWVESVIKEFETTVKPLIPSLEKGIVHGDFHDENVILLNTKDEEDYKKKYGIIDFGDLCLSSYVFDLATSLAFFMISASVEDFVGHTASFM